MSVSRVAPIGARSTPPARASLDSEKRIAAAGKGNPWVNMTDGHDLLTAFEGADARVQTLARGDAQPLALGSADFDDDGMPDLVIGYSSPSGGMISELRGNVDSVYPNSDAARQRKAESTFDDAPFLSPGRVFETDAAPDFIQTGDFDADGHQDIVLASREDSSLYFMSGDGRGGFKGTEAIVLPGRITALASGDVNRRDGLSDLAVAVDATDSPRLLVFEGPRGAVKSTPESFELPAAASAINIANLNEAPEAVIAVAAGTELLLIQGRDRKLFLDERSRGDVPAPEIVRRDFPSKLTSLAVGDFVDDLSLDLGVSLEDGTVQLVTEVPTRGAATQSARGRQHELVIRSLASNVGSAGSRLFGARLSSLAHETLVMADRDSRKLRVWIDDADRRSRNDPTLLAAPGQQDAPVTMDVDEEPVDVLPMRLNPDGISDLVVIRRGHAAPGILVSISSVRGVCNMSDCGSIGCGSLRAAILEANNTPGADTITFQQGTFDQIPTIQIGTPLPALTEALTIDGAQAGNVSCGSAAADDLGTADFTPQSLIKIQIMSNNNVGDAVTIGNGGCVVRNLVINRVGNGIHIANSSQSFVEGNFIGVNTNASDTSQNSARGVFVDNAPRNTIGGNTNAINVISGSAIGIDINGGNATDNVVRFNNIGANANATVALGNRGNGVRIVNSASRNKIGAAVSFGRDNAIYGSNTDGVAILSGTGNLVQANLFQVNQADGVFVGSSGNTVGGPGRPFTNFIWSSVANGVEINGAATSNNLIQGNRIGLDFDAGGNAIDFGRHNNGHGIAISGNASGNIVGDAADGTLGNFIAFNQADGLSVLSGTGNRILVNSIFSNAGLGIDLGNDGRDTNDDQDADQGANDKQNYPELISANITAPGAAPLGRIKPASVVAITVSLNSTPNQSFDIRFYHCANPCSGSGDQFTGCIPRPLGTRTVTTDAAGKFSQEFSFDLGAGVSTGFLNATAMNNTTGSTSEFSSCFQIGACSYSIDPTSATVGAASGDGSFAIATQNGCAWTATSNVPWLTTSSAGTGNGTINYSYQQNTAEDSRTGTITVGGRTYTVTQAGANTFAIISACKGEGKKLIINGAGFVEGAKVLLNGGQEKTEFVSATQVIAKKAGKRAATGDSLRVRNPDGSLSTEFSYTKNSCFTQ